jgi:hypothetical protein
METFFSLLEALQNAELPTALRLSTLAYPLVNATHILGLALLFGSIFTLDLRLLGFWPSIPMVSLSRVLLPVAIGGLITALLTGALLFSVHAVKYAGMSVFQLKLLLVVLAITNALLLHRTSAWKSAIMTETSLTPAFRIRIAALSSIMLWGTVILCGRMIAYYA